MPRRGKGRLPHHDLRVAQHVLVPGRVEHYAAGVGVNTMDMQDTKLPLLLCPLQHLHKTNPSRNVSECIVSASTVLLKMPFWESVSKSQLLPHLISSRGYESISLYITARGYSLRHLFGSTLQLNGECDGKRLNQYTGLSRKKGKNSINSMPACFSSLQSFISWPLQALRSSEGAQQLTFISESHFRGSWFTPADLSSFKLAIIRMLICNTVSTSSRVD